MDTTRLAPILAELREKQGGIDREYLRFLRLDLDIAMSFISMAQTTANPETRVRNLRHALRAYEVVSRDVSHRLLGEEDDVYLRHRLLELRDALTQVWLHGNALTEG